MLLLQSMGLIALKADVAEHPTLLDVENNPLSLNFIVIEGAQQARAFDDVTASATYITFDKHGGLNEKNGLAFDNKDLENVRHYALRWVAALEHTQDARLLRFIQVYQHSLEFPLKGATLVDRRSRIRGISAVELHPFHAMRVARSAIHH